ncbi:MAG: peptide deformylase [Clostridiales Family XIII bacterium]|jgi:peptide deformylase|nr:peptide deformylase [Clostridiales Family XIII bacterium]
MALRTIITEEDELLRKKSKDVKNFGERTHTLLDDMWETMREFDGVGLAAPQVGILRRAIIVDVTERDQDGKQIDASDAGQPEGNPAENESPPSADVRKPAPVNKQGGVRFELLNPEIIESEGEICEKEGCLSVPGAYVFVKRPARVKVRAVDRCGNEIVVDGEGMLARALSHEVDHLEGILLIDIAEEMDDEPE